MLYIDGERQTKGETTMEKTIETRKGCNNSTEHRVRLNFDSFVVVSPWLYTMNEDLSSSFFGSVVVEIRKKNENRPNRLVEISPNVFVLPAGLF